MKADTCASVALSAPRALSCCHVTQITGICEAASSEKGVQLCIRPGDRMTVCQQHRMLLVSTRQPMHMSARRGDAA
jgi:hypothetical protein